MNLIDREILGEPVTVMIGGALRPLAYPMHAVILYKQKTGDSLFDAKCWPLIDLMSDPERWLACLWAGLHEQQTDKSWKSPLTLDELGGLVGFDNAGEISRAMVRALTQYMPKAKDASDPKDAAPAVATKTDTAPIAISTSPSSSPAQGADSASIAPNS